MSKATLSLPATIASAVLLHTSTGCDPLVDVEAALGVELRVEGNQPRLSRPSLLQLLELLLLHFQHPLSKLGTLKVNMETSRRGASPLDFSCGIGT